MNKLSIKFLTLTSLIIIIICFFSCNKAFKTDIPYYKITDSLKLYTYFQEGSKWIYLNDTTKNLDSIEIDKVENDNAYHAADNVDGEFNYEIIELNYLPNVFNLSKGVLYAGPLLDNFKNSEVYRLIYTDSSFILPFAPGYPLGTIQNFGGQEGVYRNIEIIPSMTLNGIDFSNVYHTEEEVTDGDQVTYYEFYFAPKYGLVKWTKTNTTNTESYSLKAAYLTQ